MSKPIRVLIADDVTEMRESIKRILMFDRDIEVAGEASNGEECVRKAKELEPDIILMDINMPIMDGIKATEIVTVEVPQASIIMLSVQGEQEYLRKAMSAGAREYMTKPPSMDELISTIKRVNETELKRKRQLQRLPQEEKIEKQEGKLITFFSTKGGVGKSILTGNLAVALAKETEHKVAVIDFDLQFGDLAIILNIEARRTIFDLVQENRPFTQDVLDTYMVQSASAGVSVLPAPPVPQDGEKALARIKIPQIKEIFDTLKQVYDYIVIDTPASFHPVVAVTLDLSDIILLTATLDIPTIHNTELTLERLIKAKYPKEKLKLLLNRANTDIGIQKWDLLEKKLNYELYEQIPSDGDIVMLSVNQRMPFVISSPETFVSESVLRLARKIAGLKDKDPEETTGLFSSIKKIFGRG